MNSSNHRSHRQILSLSPLSKYLVERWLGGEVLSASISSFLSPFDLDARGGLSG